MWHEKEQLGLPIQWPACETCGTVGARTKGKKPDREKNWPGWLFKGKKTYCPKHNVKALNGEQLALKPLAKVKPNGHAVVDHRTNAQKAEHSHVHVEHYTPELIVIPSHAALGRIDLDPASNEFANQVVQADEFFEERGLEREWHGRVFLNPPGGGSDEKIDGTKSSIVRWWKKLCEEYDAGRVEAAIFVGFTLEIVQACQGHALYHPLDFPYCIPKKRIRFEVLADDVIRLLLQRIAEQPDTKKRTALEKKCNKLEPFRGQRITGDQPTHGNVISYLPRRDTARFREAFEGFGYVGGICP